MVRELTWYPVVPVPASVRDVKRESRIFSKYDVKVVADAQPRALVGSMRFHRSHLLTASLRFSNTFLDDMGGMAVSRGAAFHFS